MIHDRKCPECGATFAPRYGCQVCCSDECKRARRKRQINERRRRGSSFTTRARREAMLARLAERDRAYEREYGHPCGAPRGRYQLTDAG